MTNIKLQKNQNFKNAFTLLELLLVIAVIAILAGLVLFALNPVQRLEDATDTKTLTNANDLEKALKIYAVDNSGALPTSIQSVTTAGIYDICKSGQTIGCINLDTLVTNGKISSIPEDSRYSNVYTTGYKINFNPTKSEVSIYSKEEYISTTKYCIPGDYSFCSSPVSEWLFDEASGTIGQDTGGNNNTATLTNGASWGSGYSQNSSLALDGVNDYAQVNNNALINNMSRSTISLWIYLNNLSTAQIPISKDGDSGYYIQLNTNGQAYIRYGSAVAYAGSVGSITTGTWIHLTMVYNGSTLVLYKNGVLLSGSGTGTAPVGQDDKLWIGGYSSNGGASPNSYFINGLIDNVRIYNYARTSEQIIWEYNKGLPVAHWKMDEASGTTLADSSGNNNTVTVAGTNWTTGIYNNALDMTGTTSSYGVLPNAVLNGYTNFTIAYWMKSNDITKDGTAIHATNSGNNEFIAYNYRNLMIYLKDSLWNSGIALNNGQWRHVAITRNGTTGEIKLYIDGYIRGSGVLATGSLTVNCLVLGQEQDTVCGGYDISQAFLGQLDDFKIYNYILTPSQVMETMHEI